jgi:C4-type Zn-finger protein
MTKLKEEHRPVLLALYEFQAELPVDQTCPSCKSAIAVEGIKAGTPYYNVWITSCGCGKCNSTNRGL